MEEFDNETSTTTTKKKKTSSGGDHQNILNEAWNRLKDFLGKSSSSNEDSKKGEKSDQEDVKAKM
jgi:1,2-phenylacetyl-CoA epoxidase catalytic subunit